MTKHKVLITLPLDMYLFSYINSPLVLFQLNNILHGKGYKIMSSSFTHSTIIIHPHCIDQLNLV